MNMNISSRVEISKKTPSTLNDSQQLFLEKYLFGKWRFSERLLLANSNAYNSRLFNFSSLGVEELIDYLSIRYTENEIEIMGLEPTSFTKVRDMYLFAFYGGMDNIQNPQYQIKQNDSNTVLIAEVNHDPPIYKADFEGSENFIMITLKESHGYNMGLAIYVDPSNTEEIYLSFCGLWKMKRKN